MARFQCPVCHGVYHDPDAAGYSYFHACPPLAVDELAALPEAENLAHFPQLKAGFTSDELAAAASSKSVARPGARNENIVPGFTHPPRAAGDVTPFPPAPAIAGDPPRILLGDV
jgi:hypothetical protein